MSDSFTTLVFQKSTKDSFEEDSRRLRDFLLNNGILITSEDDMENVYRPGPRADQTVSSPHFTGFDLLMNQAEILKGRHIFSEMEGAEFFLTCRKCSTTFDGLKSPVIELLDLFLESDPLFVCPDCEHQEDLKLCQTKGFAAGFLGLQIWNWGKLKSEFIEELTQQMGTITVIEGVL